MEEKKFSIKSVMKKTAIVFSLVLVVGVLYSISANSLPDSIPKGSTKVVKEDRAISKDGLEVGNTHIYSYSKEVIEERLRLLNKEHALDIENAIKVDSEVVEIGKVGGVRVANVFIGDYDRKENSVGYVPLETIKEYVVIEIKDEDGEITHYSIDAIGHDGKAITTGWDIP